MTRHETGIIMDILNTAYPGFYNRPGAPDRVRTLDLWAELFADDDVALVAAAVKAYIASDEKGYPPHIGAVKNAMHALSRTGELDAAQAWELVRKAVSRSGYEAAKEYRKLPESLQRMTSPGQLHEWSQMDSNAFNSVVASNFQKAYRVRQESNRRDALLPADVKRVITGVAGHLALEDGR